MTMGFSGEVAAYYAKYRRGYSSQVLDVLQAALELDANDVVLDLGCGTGQLAIPLASRVRSVIGMDPEADMLRLAKESAAREPAQNVTWVLGSDADVPDLGTLLGKNSLALTVIGNAIHWMDYRDLFVELRPLCRARGGVAVIANGTPLWLQDSDWSRALLGSLERHYGRKLEATCGTGTHDRIRYAQALHEAGFEDVQEVVIEQRDELSFDQIIGGVYSAMPVDELPEPGDRADLTERVRQELGPQTVFVEDIRVSVLVGRVE
ncbi:class I SAM-dependent methyltransferase [Streptomyces sp. NPDC059215]|uniref:class I SAM-dependent methyltransferase n=1 Tax=Streptomyces sp. NPDC059215 TaxID=3346772 RepID=UPI003694D3A8